MSKTENFAHFWVFGHFFTSLGIETQQKQIVYTFRMLRNTQKKNFVSITLSIFEVLDFFQKKKVSNVDHFLALKFFLLPTLDSCFYCNTKKEFCEFVSFHKRKHGNDVTKGPCLKKERPIQEKRLLCEKLPYTVCFFVAINL